MKNIPGKSVDMCLADPPYGSTRCSWDVIIEFDPMWKQLKRIVKDNGAICIFGREPFSSCLRVSNIEMFKYDWIWKKTEPSNHYNAKKMPLRTCESVSVFYDKQPRYNPQKTTGHKRKVSKRTAEKDNNQIYGANSGPSSYDSTERYPVEVLEYSRKKQTNKLHPSQKPVELLEYMLKTYTTERDIVLDFSMGSGSTGVACRNLNRGFIGIEEEEKYYKIAKGRIFEDKD